MSDLVTAPSVIDEANVRAMVDSFNEAAESRDSTEGITRLEVLPSLKPLLALLILFLRGARVVIPVRVR